MNKTTIGWCTHSSNPLCAVNTETGALGWFCVRVSDGCRGCYAARLNRERWGNGLDYSAANRGKVEWRLDEAELGRILRRKKPARIFMCDMTDLFHEDVPDEYLDDIWLVMSLAPQHTFLLLTKRPDRMRRYVEGPFSMDRVVASLARFGFRIPHYMRMEERYFWIQNAVTSKSQMFEVGCAYVPNLWLGVSVENQQTADERIPLLLQTPAAHRFVSYEPALGPVRFREIDWTALYLAEFRALRDEQEDESKRQTIDEIIAGVNRDHALAHPTLDALTGYRTDGEDDVTQTGDPRVDWLIIGGESGPGHRPMQLEWLESAVAQAKAAGVKVFVKQWHGFRPGQQGEIPDDLWALKETPGEQP